MYPVIREKDQKSRVLQKVYILQRERLGSEIQHNCAGVCSQEQGLLEYLQFPKLEQIPRVKHLFTTRTGGVSKEHLASMNLSFARGDLPKNVLENYKRIGSVLGCNEECFVASHQTHTTNIRVVTKADAGKGIIRERDYSDIDGLVTNVPGLVLTCYYADCVPLYFVDPTKNVIGLAHSGWRGTVAGMGACMVEKLQQEYGCRPEDLIAAIGPSICRDCYEISEEVADAFRKGFWEEKNIASALRKITDAGIYPKSELLRPGKVSGKYQLDLWLANLIVLVKAGIRSENVDVTDICTCCNPQYLFSHRASNGMRGNLAACLMLSE